MKPRSRTMVSSWTTRPLPHYDQGVDSKPQQMTLYSSDGGKNWKSDVTEGSGAHPGREAAASARAPGFTSKRESKSESRKTWSPEAGPLRGLPPPPRQQRSQREAAAAQTLLSSRGPSRLPCSLNSPGCRGARRARVVCIPPPFPEKPVLLAASPLTGG